MAASARAVTCSCRGPSALVERTFASSASFLSACHLSSIFFYFRWIGQQPFELRSDPFIAPVPGEWGPCALCRSYSKLTEAHVPPKSVGNTDEWITKSYMTALSTRNGDVYYPRHFKGGLKFKTLCRDCNSSLGGREDKAIGDFFGQVRQRIKSPIVLATPNHSCRGQTELDIQGAARALGLSQ